MSLKDKEFSFAFNKEGEWEQVEEGQEYFLTKDVKNEVNKLKNRINEENWFVEREMFQIIDKIFGFQGLGENDG